MSLYRIGRIWHIDIASNAGRIRRTTGTADRKAAEELHHELEKRLWRQEKLGEAPPITWGQAVKKWMDEAPRGMPDRYTISAMGIAPATYLPLSASFVESILPANPSTFNRYLALIVSIHNLSKVAPPAVKRKKNPAGRTRWLRAEEWERLRKALKKESPLLEQAARFAIATGLRENNVLNLEWRQIVGHTALIDAPDMKQRSDVGVPLTDAAMAVLDERRGTHKRYVFAHPDSGKPLYKASNRAWYDALRKAGLYEEGRTGVNWHTLRHTWASWHIMGGTRIEELQKLGGWKTLTMVQRYAHLATEHLAAVAENAKPVSMRYNKPRNTNSRQRNVKQGG